MIVLPRHARFVAVLLGAWLTCGACTAQESDTAEQELAEARALIERARGSFERAQAVKLAVQAEKVLTAAIGSGQLPPDRRAEALRLRASTYLALREYAAAIEDSSAAIELQPENIRNLVLRATAYELTRDLDAAIADLSRLIELPGDVIGIYGDRGRMRLERGELEAAIADLTREIEGDPGGISVIELRGDAYTGLGQFDQALADYRRCIEMEQQLRQELFGTAASDGFNPAEIDLRLKVAGVMEQSGEQVEALEEYRQILSMEPMNAEANSRLSALSGDARGDPTETQ